MDYIKYIREKVGNDILIMVGCGAFIYKDGKVLLQKRRDNGCWGSHGGYMEIGETTEETVRREVFEETGLIAGELEFLGVYSGPDMIFSYSNGDNVCLVNIVYICQDFSGEMLNETEETLELKWFDIDNLPNEFSATDRRFVDDFILWANNAGI